MSFGGVDQSFITPGGMGGFGGGACGGPMWLLLGLLFARGGFGGMGGTGAAATCEFNGVLDSINGSRAETISAVSAARSEQLSASQSIANTVNSGRMESAAQLSSLLQAVASGNTNVKEQLFSLIGSTSAENRALFTNTLDSLCNLKFLGAEQTNRITTDINGAAQLFTAQFNCLSKEVAALSCGQANILREILAIVPAIVANNTLTKAQERAEMLAARVQQLEQSASQVATETKLNSIINLLSIAGVTLPVARS